MIIYKLYLYIITVYTISSMSQTFIVSQAPSYHEVAPSLLAPRVNMENMDVNFPSRQLPLPGRLLRVPTVRRSSRRARLTYNVFDDPSVIQIVL